MNIKEKEDQEEEDIQDMNTCIVYKGNSKHPLTSLDLFVYTHEMQ